MKGKYFSVIKLTTMNIKPSAPAKSCTATPKKNIIKTMQQWKCNKEKENKK